MSDSETPPRSHRTPSPGESLTDWRIAELERAVSSNDRKLDRILEKMHDKESSHLVAIERCASHGREIEELRTEVANAKRDPLTFWTSVGAGLTAIGTAIAQVFGHK